MNKIIAAALGLLISTNAIAAETRIGAVSTTWRLLGPNDKIVVERFDDPKVTNASCYLSRAETGGVMGSIGLASDPNRFSIACRATGKIKITGDVAESEVVFGAQTSAFFKTLRVTRMFDPGKSVLVYLVWSTELINGSPFNSVTAIPTE